MFTHILVPTDGSEFSETAIKTAVALAHEQGAKLTGLHVIPEFHIVAYSPEMLTDTEETFRQIARKSSDNYLAFIKQAAAQVGIECETIAVEDEHPYQVIVNMASERNCDLIVMASHGRRGMQALLIGSEAQKVLTHSQVPVLIIRPRADARANATTQSGALPVR